MLVFGHASTVFATDGAYDVPNERLRSGADHPDVLCDPVFHIQSQLRLRGARQHQHLQLLSETNLQHLQSKNFELHTLTRETQFWGVISSFANTWILSTESWLPWRWKFQDGSIIDLTLPLQFQATATVAPSRLHHRPQHRPLHPLKSRRLLPLKRQRRSLPQHPRPHPLKSRRLLPLKRQPRSLP